METLRKRAAILKRIRDFFEERGSLEVSTPAIVRSPGVDAHLDAIAVQLSGGPAGTPQNGWLRTSPEYHMKRLLAAGSGAIHQLAPAWRDGEKGELHEPEFTLLEWYRPGADDSALMDETEALVRDLASNFADGVLSHQGTTCQAGQGAPAFERITFREAFERHTGLDPINDSTGRLGIALRAGGVRVQRPASREQLVDLLLAFVVQPRLGEQHPCFVTDWPVDRAALARVRPGRDADQAASAARFELYACGIELCNGYFELSCAEEQRARIESENKRREDLGKAPYPVDEDFLAALSSGLPDCAGNALGIDRLLMLLNHSESLREVRSFLVDLS
ncbi:MAG: hypothetical protein CMP23_06785 [Rickettsiales bacterium]|nr:hypothetical protein [Rickettsiales bacterium]